MHFSFEDFIFDWGRSLGVTAIGAGVLLVVFRKIVSKDIFPVLNTRNATAILKLIITFTFAIALSTIAGWVFVATDHDRHVARLFAMFMGNANANAIKELKDDDLTSQEDQSKLRYVQETLPAQKAKFTTAIGIIEGILGDSRFNISASTRKSAKSKFNAGDPSETVSLLRMVAEKSPGDAGRALHAIAVILETNGQLDEALGEYHKASLLDPNSESYFTDAVELAMNIGNIPTASLLVGQKLQIAEQFPIPPEKLAYYRGLEGSIEWYKGQMRAAQSKYALAMSLITSAPSIELAKLLNDSAGVFWALANFGEAERRLIKAGVMFECLLGTGNSRTKNSFWNLSRLYIIAGRFEHAKAVLAKINTTKKREIFDSNRNEDLLNVVMPLSISGNIHQGLGELDAAVGEYQKAIELMNTKRWNSTFRYARVSRYLGESYLLKRDEKNAEARFQASLALNQKIFGRHHSETLYVTALLAVVDATSGNLDSAKGTIDSVLASYAMDLRSTPEFASVLEAAAIVEGTRGEHSAALIHLRQAIDIVRADSWIDPLVLAKYLTRLRSEIGMTAPDNKDTLDKEISNLNARSLVLRSERISVENLACGKS